MKNKPIIEAFVKDLDVKFSKGQISFSRMVELINEKAIEFSLSQTKELKASLEQKDLEYKKLQDSLLDVSRKALEELDNRDKTIQELKGKLEVMSNALKVCHKSLYTYGTHPIIDSQVEKALSQIK